MDRHRETRAPAATTAVPPPLVAPLDDNDRLVSLIADVTSRPPEEVRGRLRREELEPGSNVRAAMAADGVPPHVWGPRLAELYRHTDAFLYELVAHNRSPHKLAMRAWVAAALAPGAPLDVLVYGDGAGFDSLHLARAGHRVAYYEVSQPGIRFARRLFRAAGVGARFLEGEAGIPPESFDAIVCLDVLEHVPDPPALVGQMARWLRPGGRLVVSAPFFAVSSEFPTHLRANRRYSGALRELYGSHGLTVAGGRLFHNPLVLAKPPADRAPGGVFRRWRVWLGALLLSAARWWSAPHVWVDRLLRHGRSRWLQGLG